jgi:hypothetical protein
MDPLSLGVVLAVLGMGGTLITLYLFSLIASLLKRLFPVEPPAPQPATGGSAPGVPSANPDLRPPNPGPN